MVAGLITESGIESDETELLDDEKGFIEEYISLREGQKDTERYFCQRFSSCFECSLYKHCVKCSIAITDSVKVGVGK
ncbi:MAG: hypothetical protein K8E24_014440 [Methanobacterium paludis]|nr:hypothetical protein [Methanobacterium paludis]